MNVAASAFEPSPLDARGVNRAIGWSFAIHVAIVAGLFVVPREWITKPPPTKPLVITLGPGTTGQRTTGTSAAGGRTVEQVAPPQRRPEPVRPTPPAPPAPAPARTPPQAARPAERPRPAPEPPARTPTTGQQVVRGNTPVDTGARGQGAGLTFGRGGSGGETDLKDFCCPAYLELLRQRIDENWSKNQSDRGTTTVRFTVRRDGGISGITVSQSSGIGLLDRASTSAVYGVRLPPLPAEYTFDTLTINLQFPYGGS